MNPDSATYKWCYRLWVLSVVCWMFPAMAFVIALVVGLPLLGAIQLLIDLFAK